MNFITRVVIESPFAGDLIRNRAYLLACLSDAGVV